MSDTRNAMREYLILDEKRRHSPLPPEEEQRWYDLGQFLYAAHAPQHAYAAPQRAPLGYYAEDGYWYPYPADYTGPGYPPPDYVTPNGAYAADAYGYPPADYAGDCAAAEAPAAGEGVQMQVEGWGQPATGWGQPAEPSDSYSAPLAPAEVEAELSAAELIADEEVLEVSGDDILATDEPLPAESHADIPMVVAELDEATEAFPQPVPFEAAPSFEAVTSPPGAERIPEAIPFETAPSLDAMAKAIAPEAADPFIEKPGGLDASVLKTIIEEPIVLDTPASPEPTSVEAAPSDSFIVEPVAVDAAASEEAVVEQAPPEPFTVEPVALDPSAPVEAAPALEDFPPIPLEVPAALAPAFAEAPPETFTGEPVTFDIPAPVEAPSAQAGSEAFTQGPIPLEVPASLAPAFAETPPETFTGEPVTFDIPAAVEASAAPESPPETIIEEPVSLEDSQPYPQIPDAEPPLSLSGVATEAAPASVPEATFDLMATQPSLPLHAAQSEAPAEASDDRVILLTEEVAASPPEPRALPPVPVETAAESPTLLRAEEQPQQAREEEELEVELSSEEVVSEEPSAPVQTSTPEQEAPPVFEPVIALEAEPPPFSDEASWDAQLEPAPPPEVQAEATATAEPVQAAAASEDEDVDLSSTGPQPIPPDLPEWPPEEASPDLARFGTSQELEPEDRCFIEGEHRVIIHTLEGQVKRGLLRDVDLLEESIPLEQQLGFTPERVPAERIKAIFFMLPPGGKQPASGGNKIRVTFADGRQVAGFSEDYSQNGRGFFLVPADNRTNTARIYIYRASVQSVLTT
jgi:hypothetical protein